MALPLLPPEAQPEELEVLPLELLVPVVPVVPAVSALAESGPLSANPAVTASAPPPVAVSAASAVSAPPPPMALHAFFLVAGSVVQKSVALAHLPPH